MMAGVYWHDSDEEWTAADQMLAAREAEHARLIRFDPEYAARLWLEQRDNLLIEIQALRFSRWVVLAVAAVGWLLAGWWGLR